MSTVRVTVTVEVDGFESFGKPVLQQWKHTHRDGDNPRFYDETLLKAVTRAVDKVLATWQQP